MERVVRVLVVDDEPDIRLVVSMLLEHELGPLGRVEVEESPDAADAVRRLEAHPFDLVLTDYAMPGRTGAELLAEVRARWPRTARVMMSGYCDIQIEAGPQVEELVHGFLAKPWQDDHFAMIVRAALDAPDAEA